MNKIITLILFTIVGLSVQAQGPIMTFKDTVQYDMGTFKQGEIAAHTFEFTNTGSVALKIEQVRTTCSCTASEWPKEAIAPGKTSSIKVTFDTNDKLGEYAKGVNVFTNAGESNLIIMVKVIKNDQPVPKPHIETGDHEGHNHK